MLKHCPSLRMERGEGRISIHNEEDVELGGKMRIVDLKEGGISEQERSKFETSSENETAAVCSSCGGQHSRLRVYRASPAEHKQQQHCAPMMDFTTVLISPTTTSAMVVKESLRRYFLASIFAKVAPYVHICRHVTSGFT